MFVDTRYRSTAPEMMDNFQMEGSLLRDALDKIAAINRLLGGNKVTLEGVGKLLKWSGQKENPDNRPVRVLDVGCGNGDMLRAMAKYALHKGVTMELIGLDANAFTVKHAESLSAGYPNISYRCADIFNELKMETELPESDFAYDKQPYDIILCTLTLHHFTDEEILRLISVFDRQAGMGIVINDLQRSALAYYLFKGLCWVFNLNDMSREDGLVSILRGFKKKDLERYSAQLIAKDARGLPQNRVTIRWKWAFRYQWIISST